VKPGLWGQTSLMVQALIVFVSVAVLAVTRRLRRHRLPAQAVIVSPRESTVISRDGAVRSVQSAELTISRADLDRLWNASNLENLARTYWRFLQRVTLGLIRVIYGENERSVAFVLRPLTLLRFGTPQYAMDPVSGSVRWYIRDGLLVAKAGRGSGFLAIEVTRMDGDGSASADTATLRIDIEVANFYPSIASGFGRLVYEATQSAVHLLVTHAFLRSLARLDLAQSKVGRLAGPASENGGAPTPADEVGAQP
jgi:hypothetical protein